MENTLNIESRTYRLTGLTPILGTQPANYNIRTTYIASKAPTDALREEELSEFDLDSDENGVTVFTRNKRGQLCLMAHHLNGFFKEALKATATQVNIAAIKGKIDTLVFPEPRFIPLKRNGEALTDEDEMLERPLRAETPKGPRTALQSSEMVNDPWEIEFELSLLPNKGTAKSEALTWDAIEVALQYGQFRGLGQWRNAGYGKFRFERVDGEDE